MKFNLEKAENLLNNFFDQFIWHDSKTNPMVIILEESIVYDWGGLVIYASKNVVESKTSQVGLKPVIIDIRKNIVKPIIEWPLISVEFALQNYMQTNGYP